MTAVLLAGVASGPGRAPAATLPIGAAAPDFSLQGVDGKTRSLQDFADARLLVIVFTCNHCPTAQAYEQRIVDLAKQYRPRGVALVAISPNDPKAVRLDELGYTDVGDSLEDMKLRAKDRGFDFPYLYDGDKQEVARAYGPVATPHVFIFDGDRKLRYCGRVDDSDKPDRVASPDARNALDALLAGKPVPVEKTKTFGCSIKWSDKRDSVARSLANWAEEEVTVGEIDTAAIKALVANDSRKLRLINVWATFCGPCVGELPEFVKMNRMYRRRDFELVTISADSPEEKDKALAALKRAEASSANYVAKTKDKYELVEAVDPKWEGPLPYTLLVAPGGKVLYRKQGPCEPLDVRRAIVGYLGRTYK